MKDEKECFVEIEQIVSECFRLREQNQFSNSTFSLIIICDQKMDLGKVFLYLL